jgi:formylmethanofuran dehydrogenase subunit E
MGIEVKCNKCGEKAPKTKEGYIDTRNPCKCGGIFIPKINPTPKQ